MKAWVFSLLCLGWALFSGCGKAGTEEGGAAEASPPEAVAAESRSGSIPHQNGRVQRYGYESGILRLKSKASVVESETTLYFDNFGAVEARYTRAEARVGGQPMIVEDSLLVSDQSGVYSWDFREEKGIKYLSAPQQGGFDIGGLIAGIGEEAAEDYLERHSIKRLPDDTVLGYDCEVYEIMGMMTTWVHQGLQMKMTHKSGPMVFHQEVVEFQPNASVDPSKFRFPEGVDRASFPEVSNHMGANH